METIIAKLNIMRYLIPDKVALTQITKTVEKSLEDITIPLTVSIIGCVVNGPGEATMTQIGVTGGGNDTHMIYINGKKDHRIKNKDLPIYLEKIIRREAENQKDAIKWKFNL